MNTSGQCFCLLYFALLSTASLLLFAVAMLRKSLSLSLFFHSLTYSLSLFPHSLALSFSRCEPTLCLKCPPVGRSCCEYIRPCRCVFCLSTGDEPQEIDHDQTTIEYSKGLCFYVCCKRHNSERDRTKPEGASMNNDDGGASQPLVQSVNSSGK